MIVIHVLALGSAGRISEPKVSICTVSTTLASVSSTVGLFWTSAVQDVCLLSLSSAKFLTSISIEYSYQVMLNLLFGIMDILLCAIESDFALWLGYSFSRTVMVQLLQR